MEKAVLSESEGLYEKMQRALTRLVVYSVLTALVSGVNGWEWTLFFLGQKPLWGPIVGIVPMIYFIYWTIQRVSDLKRYIEELEFLYSD